MPACLYDQSAGKYYYDHFVVAMIDNNLVYRTMRLHITEKDNFSVDQLRVYGKAKTTTDLAAFRREAQTLVAKVAKKTQASCTLQP